LSYKIYFFYQPIIFFFYNKLTNSFPESTIQIIVATNSTRKQLPKMLLRRQHRHLTCRNFVHPSISSSQRLEIFYIPIFFWTDSYEIPILWIRVQEWQPASSFPRRRNIGPVWLGGQLLAWSTRATLGLFGCLILGFSQAKTGLRTHASLASKERIDPSFFWAWLGQAAVSVGITSRLPCRVRRRSFFKRCLHRLLVLLPCSPPPVAALLLMHQL
jgi:hypothetical protein